MTEPTGPTAQKTVGRHAEPGKVSGQHSSSEELPHYRLRAGLPRLAGGPPWPAAGVTPRVQGSCSAAEVPARATSVGILTLGQAGGNVSTRVQVRRGLPRVTGGDPWPPGGNAHIAAAVELVAEPVVRQVVAVSPAMIQTPVPVNDAAGPGIGVEVTRRPRRALILLGGFATVVISAVLVLGARWLMALPDLNSWLARYPGEYTSPMEPEPGFPWWARWSHFFNFFLMVLIIRSGLLIRYSKRAAGFWTPSRGGSKINLTLWLHKSLDLLWIFNGLTFVVLLFVSGHWARIVPTSWEVFPNALSALLQYLALDWPVEHGWANYNSLQQIMYFVVVFMAGPVAIASGLRLSSWWPQHMSTLNRLYPASVARAIHFPTMAFFVLFIFVHVCLVLSTGALRNLNHMFAGTDLVNGVGFWILVAALAATVVGWVACRSFLLATVAGAFGKVTQR